MHDSNTGHLEDLSHIVNEYCVADPLAKHTAKPDQLINAITTGRLEKVDVPHPFRTLIKHNAFLTSWVLQNMDEGHQPVSFLAVNINF